MPDTHGPQEAWATNGVYGLNPGRRPETPTAITLVINYLQLFTEFFLQSGKFCLTLHHNQGEYQSGQMGQTVNLLAYAFGGSNPSSPTKLRESLSGSPASFFQAPQNRSLIYPTLSITSRALPKSLRHIYHIAILKLAGHAHPLPFPPETGS